MKYLKVTFRTQPCNEPVNDVLSALSAEIGFESFMDAEGGIDAYIQEKLFDEEALKEMILRTRTGTRSGRRTSSNPS
jgi:ribosomal protein L11 methyltransferase